MPQRTFVDALCERLLQCERPGRSSVWVERHVWDVEVAGSNPAAPTPLRKGMVFRKGKLRFPFLNQGEEFFPRLPFRKGRPGRSALSGSTDRRENLGFPSYGASHMICIASDAPVAQLEEQWVSNPLVAGSSPAGRVFLLKAGLEGRAPAARGIPRLPRWQPLQEPRKTA